MNKRALGFLIFLFILSILGSLVVGKYPFTLSEYAGYFEALLSGDELGSFSTLHTLVAEIRFPRILSALIIGASLAISGAAYQAMFVNPLVSPSILGVLSGAGFGAALAMFFRLSDWLVQLSTFLFGFLAVIFALLVARLYSRGGGMIMLVLGGVISSSLFTSMLSILKYAADPNDTLPAITYFLMGSLSFGSKGFLEASFLPMLVGVILLALSGKYLNALSLGEEEAKSLGVDTFKVKFLIITASTFISALSVTIAGIIGWIGLIIPHIVRFAFGADNRIVLFASAFYGAIFLLVCDTLSRIVFTFEVPIGIVTSFFGIPIFILILRNAKRRM